MTKNEESGSSSEKKLLRNSVSQHKDKLRKKLALSDVDYHIGLPKSEQHRVARISTPGMLNRLDEIWTDVRVVKYMKSLFKLMTVRSQIKNHKKV